MTTGIQITPQQHAYLEGLSLVVYHHRLGLRLAVGRAALNNGTMGHIRQEHGTLRSDGRARRLAASVEQLCQLAGVVVGKHTARGG